MMPETEAHPGHLVLAEPPARREPSRAPAPRRRRTPARHPILAGLLSVAVAAAARLLLQPFMGDRLPYITFFPMLAAVAWYGGLRSALVYIPVSAVVTWWLFLPPPLSLTANGTFAVIGLGLYVITALIVAGFSESMHRARARAEELALAAQEQQQRLEESIREQARSEETIRLQNEELQTAIEELEVTQEELSTQNEKLLSTRNDAEMQRRRYQDLFEFAPDGYLVTDLKGVIIEGNQAAAALLGLAQPALAGEPLMGFLLEHRRDSFRARLETLKTSSSLEHWEARLSPARGQPFDAEVTVTTIRNASGEPTGYRWLIRDVTERRRADEKLALLASIVEHSSDAIIGKSPDAIITSFNPAAERLYGYKASEVIGRPVSILIPPDHHDDLPAVLERLARGETIGHYEAVRRRKDGSLVNVSVTISPIRSADGTLVGASAIARDITEQKTQETKLREWQERLETALRAGQMGAWTHDLREGRVIWSRELEEVFGLPPGSFDGREETFFQLILPEDRDTVRAIIQEAVRTRTEYDLEFRFIRPDGEVRWMAGRGRPFFDDNGEAIRLAGVGMDITERKRTEQALRESEARFRIVADTAPVLIWMTDAQGQALFQNRAVEEFFHLPTEALRDDRWMSLIHPDDLEQVRQNWESGVAARQSFRMQFRARRHDGVYRLLLSNAVPRVTADGEFVGFIGTCLDITEMEQARQELADHRDRLEELVAERTEALRTSLEQLRRSERLASIGTLAAGIAHEINNPLNAILLAAQYALECPEEVDVHHTLQNIVEQSTRGGRIVKSVLKFSREERTPKTPSPLNDAVRNAADLAGTYIGAPLNLGLDLAEGLPLVSLNRTEIEQIIVNLAKNAVEAAGTSVQIMVRTRREARGVLLQVEDNGPGIPEHIVPHIFDPFFSTRQTSGGTGLGLSLCHSIVTDHGGTIHVESRQGRGTCFTIRLPEHLGPPIEEKVDSQQGRA